ASTDMVDTIRQNFVYAVRGFRRSRAFTLIALLVLAVGIAANTTLLSVVNPVPLPPLPAADRGRPGAAPGGEAGGPAFPQRGVRTAVQPASHRSLSDVRAARSAPRRVQRRDGVL